jgi:saccharopepsin
MVEKTLWDYRNVQLFSRIYMGSDKQEFKMIFDTGSDWLWVSSRICMSCPKSHPKFDERSSHSFSFYNVIMDLHYGSGDAYGYYSHDLVCLKPDKCADDFGFMSVGAVKNMYFLQASGIVGLTPVSMDPKCDLFIEKMKKNGLIPTAEFSIYIDLLNNQSKMTLGGFDLHRFAAPNAALNFHNITNGTQHWTLTLDKMETVGGSEVQSLELGRNASIIIDSGTSFLLMPLYERNKLMEYLENTTGIECNNDELLTCQCSNQSYRLLPDLAFNFNGSQYFIPRESYVERSSEDDQCVLLIMAD